MKQTLLFCFATLTLTSIGNAEDFLTVGAKAPELKAEKWFKGKPISKLEKGKVYVVEFWATWCGPCKANIPHLSELAKKFQGKAEIIGVDIWENEPGKWDPKTFDKVAATIKEFGDKMDYNVAADGPKGTIAKAWMDAAKIGGIPTTFVIDRSNEIAWIGHPAELEKVLSEVVADKFDKASFKKTYDKQKNDEIKFGKALDDIDKALKARNYPQALKLIDTANAEIPFAGREMAVQKFRALLPSDKEAAMKHAISASETTLKGDSYRLIVMGQAILDDPRKPTSSDYQVAIKLAEAAAAGIDKGPYPYHFMAQVYDKDGQLDKAIETQEKAVALLKEFHLNKAGTEMIHKQLADLKKKKSG